MALFKPARQIKELVETELYAVCSKYIGKRTNTGVLKAELQKICDDSYIHRKCPVWFKVHLKPVESLGRVSIELEAMYYDGIPVKDGD